LINWDLIIYNISVFRDAAFDAVDESKNRIGK
jgi:hypothetical protein